MTNLPPGVEPYTGNLGRICSVCGQRVVEAIDPPEGEAYVCPSCLRVETTPESDLTRAAMEDPDAALLDRRAIDRPTAWRLLIVLLLCVFALALVFWPRYR